MQHPQTLLKALLLCTALLAPALLHAATPTATATLSSATTSLGSPVQYTLSVEGSRKVGDPPEIKIDGLQIQFAGRNQQFQMMNFQTSVTISLNYLVTPMRTGTFTIPAQTINVDGKKYSTQPLTLTVNDLARTNPTPNAASGEETPPTQLKDLAWAELIVPKNSAYVGESIPVVIRAFFDARIQFRVSDSAQLAEEGFTLKKGPAPAQERTTLNGREYSVVTFNLAVTPVKAGTISLGPAELQGLLEIPIQAPKRRSRSMFDDFFNNPFGRVQRQDIVMKTDPVDVQVKALPSEGKPIDFNGAVGRYEMTTASDATRVNIGDPTTVRVEISGRGDFDRVQPPVLNDTKGWRTYPPTSDFAEDDTLGISGKKTFQLMVIPDENHAQIPPLSFSYFDPTTEQYKTLRSDPIPITVEGQQRPLSSASPPSTKSGDSAATLSNPSPSPPTPTATAAGTRDILHIRTEAPRWHDSFTPLFKRAKFWWFQIVPFVLVASFVSYLVWKRRAADHAGKRAAALKKERETRWQQIKGGTSDPTEIVTAAVRWLQVHTALRTKCAPSTIACSTILTHLQLTQEDTETIQTLFAYHDELRYAGTESPAAVPPEFLDAVRSTLTRLQNHG